MKNAHLFFTMLQIYLHCHKSNFADVYMTIVVAYIISYCFHVLYFMQSYMFVYCRALLVPPLYVCFVGRETLCCLCLNKRFCIVLYWCPVTLKIISVSQASFIIEFSIMSNLCIACNKVVGKRQHGVTCDVCDRWQHRLCDTGNKFYIYLTIV